MASKKSNMPIESLPSKGSDTRKKSKTQVSLAHTFGNNAFLLASLRKTHIGKRILLRAKDIYNGTVPNGEEAFLFQYSVSLSALSGRSIYQHLRRQVRDA